MNIFKLLADKGGYTIVDDPQSFLEIGKSLRNEFEDVALSRICSFIELSQSGTMPLKLMEKMRRFIVDICGMYVGHMFYIQSFSVAQPVIMTKDQYQIMCNVDEIYKWDNNWSMSPAKMNMVAKTDSMVLVLIEME